METIKKVDIEPFIKKPKKTVKHKVCTGAQSEGVKLPQPKRYLAIPSDKRTPPEELSEYKTRQHQKFREGAIGCSLAEREEIVLNSFERKCQKNQHKELDIHAKYSQKIKVPKDHQPKSLNVGARHLEKPTIEKSVQIIKNPDLLKTRGHTISIPASEKHIKIIRIAGGILIKARQGTLDVKKQIIISNGPRLTIKQTLNKQKQRRILVIKKSSVARIKKSSITRAKQIVISRFATLSIRNNPFQPIKKGRPIKPVEKPAQREREPRTTKKGCVEPATTLPKRVIPKMSSLSKPTATLLESHKKIISNPKLISRIQDEVTPEYTLTILPEFITIIETLLEKIDKLQKYDHKQQVIRLINEFKNNNILCELLVLITLGIHKEEMIFYIAEKIYGLKDYSSLMTKIIRLQMIYKDIISSKEN